MEMHNIKVTDSSGCDKTVVGTDHMYCVCKSGQRTESNCPIQSKENFSIEAFSYSLIANFFSLNFILSKIPIQNFSFLKKFPL